MAIARPIHRLTEVEYLEIKRAAEIDREFTPLPLRFGKPCGA